MRQTHTHTQIPRRPRAPTFLFLQESKKGKVASVHAKKVYGSSGTAPLILNLGARIWCDQLHEAAPLPWGRNSRYTLNRRLGGPLSRCGHSEEDVTLPPTGIRTREHPARNLSHNTDYTNPAPPPNIHKNDLSTVVLPQPVQISQQLVYGLDVPGIVVPFPARVRDLSFL
jgi:hypothetical protein